MRGANTVEDKEEYGSVASYTLRDQIKNLIAMAGGVFASEKAFKAIYAILQSLSPSVFSLEWDALFFSIYSKGLHDELASLILETEEVKEALWGRGFEPFHHIYLLTEKGRRSLGKDIYELQKEPFYEDFLLWSLLPPKFAIYWSYLLEMRSYEELDEEQKKKIPYLPLLKDEPDSRTRKRLQEKLDKFCITLSELNIKPLNVGNLCTSEDNNLYIFLPFKFGPTQKERFVEFYKSYMRNRYVRIMNTPKEDILAVQVDPKGITAIYHYIGLSKAEIMIGSERFDLDIKDFGDLLTYYTSQVYHRITPHENCYADYYFIKERARKRQKLLDGLPEEVKQGVIDRAQLFLEILYQYYELSQWRYDHIMKTLGRLASITEQIPITLLCKSIELEGYLNDIEIKEQTLIGFEFSEEFRERYKREFKYGLPSGNLHHIYHFVQPEEALKAIYTDKERYLLWGGPVVGEY